MQQDETKYCLGEFEFPCLDDLAYFGAMALDLDTSLDETIILDSEFDFSAYELYAVTSLDEASELTATQKDELQKLYKKYIDSINKERSNYYRDYYPQKTIRGSNPDFD
jgi:hypothetical protein